MSVAGIVLRKELREGLRDRRALVSLFVFPLVGPLLVSGMLTVLVERATSSRPVTLPVVGADRAPGLVAHLRHDGIEVVEAPPEPAVAVRTGGAPLVLVISEDYGRALRAGRGAHLELVVDRAREESQSAIRRVEHSLRAYARTVGALRLLARGLPPELAEGVIVEEVDLATPEARGAALLHFVPMFVLLAAFVGGMHVASDSTAGERERGSLEPLLGTPASRRALVVGKWLAALCFAAVNVVVTLASTAAALGRVPLHRFGMAATLSVRDLALVLLVVLPLAAFVSALQLLVASFARTVKEAQITLSMLTFVPMASAFFLSVQPAKPTSWLSAIPILGQEVLLAALVRGEPIGAVSFGVAAAACGLGALACVLATGRLFESERMVQGR